MNSKTTLKILNKRCRLHLKKDISEDKKKEIEYQNRLRSAVDEAQRASIAKTDFLRRMSHDIKTPINGIRGMLEIAEHYPDDPEKQKECRSKVRQTSGFLLALVNSVLDMNKLESGKIKLDEKPFNLAEFMDGIETVVVSSVDTIELRLSVTSFSFPPETS